MNGAVMFVFQVDVSPPASVDDRRFESDGTNFGT
jgi:hypothetical protein